MPVTLVVNTPVVPGVVVLLLMIVGVPVVFHTVPRSVTELPPSDTTVAPKIAVVLPIVVAVGEVIAAAPHNVTIFQLWSVMLPVWLSWQVTV